MGIKTYVDYFKEVREELKKKGIDRDFLTMNFGTRDGPLIGQIERVRTTFYGAMSSSGAFAQPEELAKMGYRREAIERAQSVAEVCKRSLIEGIENEYKILESHWKELKKEIGDGRKKKREFEK